MIEIVFSLCGVWSLGDEVLSSQTTSMRMQVLDYKHFCFDHRRQSLLQGCLQHGSLLYACLTCGVDHLDQIVSKLKFHPHQPCLLSWFVRPIPAYVLHAWSYEAMPASTAISRTPEQK